MKNNREVRTVELLSPAKDLAIGMAAIHNGADAVYIGAQAFGARKAAGNSMKDLAILVKYAHRFYCRVFVTLNTILYDSELPEAERLIHQLYAIGVDALIVQDLAILKLDLPPIPLHASTQMHNYDLERIQFLDRIGFQRIVLARELSLEQIRAIRREVRAELEVFIHGALCVSLSGQCYLSQYMSGRSANRGECAQPCRMKWSVKDRAENVLLHDCHVLSLKDLNLSASIGDLIDAGVDSFKIEGRLKEENYVSNVTSYYSSLINEQPGIRRVGSGEVISAFDADPERSFNRGCTDYFMDSRKKGMVNMDTPKSMGKRLGVVKQVKGDNLWIEADEAVNNGDGLCYLEGGELKGIKVNRVEGNRVFCNEQVTILPGTELFRNYDHRFVIRLEKEKSIRKIGIRIHAAAQEGHLKLDVTDENGIAASYETEEVFEKANHPAQGDRIRQQLMKCGDSDFKCEEAVYDGAEVLFIPAAIVNAARRCLLDRLVEAREQQRIILPAGTPDAEVVYKPEVDWHHNVVNQNAAQFYREHGAVKIENGFEKSGNLPGRELMHTRYCLLYEIGRCRKSNQNGDLKFPLFLYNAKQKFRLEFDCKECFMKIFAD